MTARHQRRRRRIYGRRRHELRQRRQRRWPCHLAPQSAAGRPADPAGTLTVGGAGPEAGRLGR